jgi:hypothetical protein
MLGGRRRGIETLDHPRTAAPPVLALQERAVTLAGKNCKTRIERSRRGASHDFAM